MNASTERPLTDSQIAAARQLLTEEEPKKALKLGTDLLRGEVSNPEAWKIIGAALGDLREFEAGIDAMNTAIELDPEDVDARISLGVMMRENDDILGSLASFRNAVRVAPGHLEAARGLHRSLLRLGVLETSEVKREAAACVDFLKYALSITPGQIDFYYSLSHIYQLFGRNEEAHELMRQVYALNPECDVAKYNLGVSLKAIGKYDEAIEYFNAIDEVNIEVLSGKVEHSKAHCLLLKEDFNKGWASYESRWEDINFPSQRLKTSRPQWSGEPNKKVLVWLEQGIGDQIMFASMLQDAAKICDELTVVCDARLVPIFERSFSSIKIVPAETSVRQGDFDFHLPMGSLGQLFRSKLEDFATASDGFLEADKKIVSKIRGNLRELGGSEIVGISWFSNSEIHSRLARNIPLQDLLQGFDAGNKTFVCLQYGDVEADISAAWQELGINVINPSDIDQFNDLDNLFNLIKACDRVVSVDNVTVHASAAMGVPTCTLLPPDADWRWAIRSNTSYWYSSMQLIRQTRPGTWEDLNLG